MNIYQELSFSAEMLQLKKKTFTPRFTKKMENGEKAADAKNQHLKN
jgi:hypothetical protein